MTYVLVTLGALYCAAEPAEFVSARPVWPEGRTEEINVFAGFRAVFPAPDHGRARLRVTASTVYRAWVNGAYCGYGPARTAHGHFRIDDWDLSPLLAPGANVVAIEVAGYNTNSYYTLDQPSFLQAEVVADGDVLASTGGDGAAFQAQILEARLQKVQRYSFQRPASEVYRLDPEADRWRDDPAAPVDTVAWAEAPAGPTLVRGVPYPRFHLRQPLRRAGSGRIEGGPLPERPWRDRSLRDVGPKLKGYPEAEIERLTSLDLQALRTLPESGDPVPYGPGTVVDLAADAYAILDFGTNLSGFPGVRVRCAQPARLILAFDEILTDGDVDWRRLGCVNAIDLELSPGIHDFEAFEPYTLRYLKLIALDGPCSVEAVTLREYVHPDVEEARFACADPELNRIFEAARETYRQNALDLFMDCPHRERAGWLCDSFFTARVARDLSGDTRVERNFIENYGLPQRFDHLPDGMLPMCYPADHPDGVFIPNWALWFVIQLEEYLARSGDRALVDALQPRVFALFDYFQPFENEDGLLEKLQSWVFIEWSEANRFVQDVNYPSNMLYAGALDAAARIYGKPELADKADALRRTIRSQSFDGAFFVDNALRRDGRLHVTDNRTEVCQYFAFYFDVATPDSHPDLWRALCDDFGPDRAQTGAHPDIHPANAFVGNTLRMEILSRYGRAPQILHELAGYLLYMAERTGTLWENQGAGASLNHGFASHAAHTLYRDVLGLRRLDTVAKTVAIHFADLDLAWCEGRLPLPHGALTLRWTRDGDTLRYRVEAPAGYTVHVEKPARLQLAEE